MLSLSKHERRDLQADCTTLNAELKALADRHVYVAARVMQRSPEREHALRAGQDPKEKSRGFAVPLELELIGPGSAYLAGTNAQVSSS